MNYEAAVVLGEGPADVLRIAPTGLTPGYCWLYAEPALVAEVIHHALEQIPAYWRPRPSDDRDWTVAMIYSEHSSIGRLAWRDLPEGRVPTLTLEVRPTAARRHYLTLLASPDRPIACYHTSHWALDALVSNLFTAFSRSGAVARYETSELFQLRLLPSGRRPRLEVGFSWTGTRPASDGSGAEERTTSSFALPAPAKLAHVSSLQVHEVSDARGWLQSHERIHAGQALQSATRLRHLNAKSYEVVQSSASGSETRSFELEGDPIEGARLHEASLETFVKQAWRKEFVATEYVPALDPFGVTEVKYLPDEQDRSRLLSITGTSEVWIQLDERGQLRSASYPGGLILERMEYPRQGKRRSRDK